MSARGRDRSGGERGAVTLVLAGASMLMAVVMLGAISIARLTIVRADVDRAADAAALAALAIISERGLPFDRDKREAAEALARQNSPLSIDFIWDVRTTDTALEIGVKASSAVDLPQLVFAGGAHTVTSRNRASLPQLGFNDAQRSQLKLALTLDYSGSMSIPIDGGSSARAIDVLEASITQLLGSNLRIDYGAVFYSSEILDQVSFVPDARRQIAEIMAVRDADAGTNTAAGFDAARQLILAAPDTGRYVLLVSDGEPNDFAAARAAAQALWAAGITIYTLEIRRQGSGAALDQFMTDVAGAPSNPGDPNYHFVATSSATLAATFRSITASILCSIGPVTPAPADPSTLRVFLVGSGGERRLAASDDLARDSALLAYRYEPSDQRIRLSETACAAITENGERAIVRTRIPRLVE